MRIIRIDDRPITASYCYCKWFSLIYWWWTGCRIVCHSPARYWSICYLTGWRRIGNIRLNQQAMVIALVTAHIRFLPGTKGRDPGFRRTPCCNRRRFFKT